MNEWTSELLHALTQFQILDIWFLAGLNIILAVLNIFILIEQNQFGCVQETCWNPSLVATAAKS